MSVEDRDATVAALVAAIDAALPGAVRGEKWNAPNWSVGGRDLVTLTLPPRGPVRVVLHRGATAVDTRTGARLIPDPEGRLAWATDQRASAAFADAPAVEAAREWLEATLRAWVAAAQ